MMTNDLRKYIQIVESTEQLDEAGGFLDKIISNLGGIPGLSDIAAGAEGRVEAKDISKTPEEFDELVKELGLEDVKDKFKLLK